VNIVAKAARLGRRSALALGMMTLASAATAQTVPDAQVPATGLDLPSNLQIFGTSDPNIRKPTAIVNDVVITGTDIDHRVAVVSALNNLQLNDEERAQLRLQILRQLIDETLQIQEAKANEIEISQPEIDQSFVRVARNFNRTPEEMSRWLREIGSSDRTIRRQIEGELAWSRLLRRRVVPMINVGDEEVNAIIQRLEEARGTEEYHLREIYLNATPDRAREVYAGMQQMLAQMREGAPFEYFARNFSDATTAATGGDLGWVRPAMLPAALAEAARSMQVGQVVGPIEVPGGFSVLLLQDKRQVLTADPRDAQLSLRQMSIRFPAGTTEAEAASRTAAFATTTQAMQGCGAVNDTAREIGADVVDNDAVVLRQLPPQLQELLINMQIGEATPPFGSVEDGVRVLVLCGRDDPPSNFLPSADQIREREEEERVNRRAERMLRDLRRDALVEYR